MCHHYSFTFDFAYEKITDKNASLSEKTNNGDCSNFTYLGSWAEHYKYHGKIIKNLKFCL